LSAVAPFNPLMPEIQKLNFSVLPVMLFDMMSWNWFEFVCREIHFLKPFFGRMIYHTLGI